MYFVNRKQFQSFSGNEQNGLKMTETDLEGIKKTEKVHQSHNMNESVYFRRKWPQQINKSRKMTNDILQRIQKRTSANESKPKTQHKTDFLAQKPDIEKAMEAGHSASIIWETLFNEKKISMAYRTFVRFVSLYIKQKGSYQTQIKVGDKKTKPHEPYQLKTEPEGFKIDHTLTLDDLV